MKVAWDAAKNLANQRRHGLSFEEAQELFLSGRDYLEIFDDAHSETEDRFIAIGPIAAVLCSSYGPSATRTRCASSALAGRPIVSEVCTFTTWKNIND